MKASTDKLRRGSYTETTLVFLAFGAVIGALAGALLIFDQSPESLLQIGNKAIALEVGILLAFFGLFVLMAAQSKRLSAKVQQRLEMLALPVSEQAL